MDDLPATRITLIARLGDRADGAAWSEFVALYEPLIRRLAMSKGLQDADAGDLCQEVFRIVSGAIDRWDPDPALGSFRAWLSRITRNLLINFLTRQHGHTKGSGSTSVQELLEAQPATDPAATAFYEAEYRWRLFEWVADQIRGEFTPSTWQAFWRTAVQGHAPAAVATELGLSLGALYVARSRVLARLRRSLDERSRSDDTSYPEVDHEDAT
jgi:RNA polymerase sigma-70 factor (ECF subfamily)